MTLKEIVEKIDKAEGWKERYQHYVPKFIEEASNKTNWDDWDTEVFKEFFEKRNQQCISSLRQGYFSEEEKKVIKDNWSELAPLLKTIALNQDTPQWDTYLSIKQTLRKYTKFDCKAATNRLIAGLQPNLLSTIVNEDMLFQLFKLLQKENIGELPDYVGGNWFQNSYAILQFFKKELSYENAWDLITFPWQTFEYLTGTKSAIENDMSETDDNDFDELIALLKHKKQVILQGPPGTGKTRLAELVSKKLTSDIVPPIDNIGMYINVGDKIKTPYDKLIFVIEAIEPLIKRIH